jgi:hypothetical protein
MGMIRLRVPVRCTIHWGVYDCPAKKIACRPSGGPIKEIGVSLRTSPASSGKDGQRVPATFTEPEYPTRRIG